MGLAERIIVNMLMMVKSFVFFSFLLTIATSTLLPCDIPNEEATGYCFPPQSCQAYQKLMASGNLDYQQQAFVDRLKCSRDRICCPARATEYKHPYVLEAPKHDDELIESCGVDTSTDRIIGGLEAKIDEFPWMALLFYESKRTKQMVPICGGVLISNRWVLTAAHCVMGKNFLGLGSLRFVRLGEHNLETDIDCIEGVCNDRVVDLDVEKTIPHPNYVTDSYDKFNDIALVKLLKEAPYTDFIRFICLPSYYNLTEPARGDRYIAAGWGRTDFYGEGENLPSKVKLKVSLPYMDQDRCRSIYAEHRIRIADSQICAGGKKAMDTCRGDSGSPLMYYNKTLARWFAYGVVSRGPSKCGSEGVPSIYTNMFKFDDWVRSTIAGN